VQGRERHLQLGLDAGCPEHEHALSRRHDVVQQRGLADAGLAVDQQRPALAGADRVDHVVEHRALGGAPPQALRLEHRIAAHHVRRS
jgi:hypothetical protein